MEKFLNKNFLQRKFFFLSKLDKRNFDQLKHIELSYNELQEKYHIAEQLEGQLKQLNEKFNEKDLQLTRHNDLFEKLKIDYERQHVYLLDRDENIRLLKLELKQQQEDLNDLIQMKTNENKNLIEKNLQLENDLKEEKEKLVNEIQSLLQKITSLEKEKKEFIQVKSYPESFALGVFIIL